MIAAIAAPPPQVDLPENGSSSMLRKVTHFAMHVPAPRELDYVKEALRAPHLSGDGPFTDRATRLLSDLLDAQVLLTTSCTHALELAALALRIGPGDEVLLPSFTFPSTANAFALRGASLRFADIDRGTFSMELPELEAAVSPRTTAVATVAYGGVSRDMAPIRAFCDARGLKLVEDAAHSLFASSGGRPLATFGALGALSFHSTKNVSCGEGGALVINDRSLSARAIVLREKGTNRAEFLRREADKYTWQDVGSSYLPSDVLAAILTAQLENAPRSQARRQAVWAAYHEQLAPVAAELGLELQQVPAGAAHPAHLFAVLLPEGSDRASVLSRLGAAGYPGASHYEPLHRAPAHRGNEVLEVTDRVASRIVRLPLHAGLETEDAARVVGALTDAVREQRRAR